MKCPCVECEKKGCGAYHDQCPEYSLYRAWRQDVCQWMAEQRKKNDISRDHERKYRFRLTKGWNKP